MATEDKLPVAGVADLGRTPVTLGVVILICLTITGIMSGVAWVVWGEVASTRTKLDDNLKEQRVLAQRTLDAVHALQLDVTVIKRELESR